jgi:hypothetical protein
VNSFLLRTGKIAALVLASVLVLLLAELLAAPGAWAGSGVPWNTLLAEIGGRPEPAPVGGEVSDPFALAEPHVRVWPVREDGVVTGVVVTASAAGYRSRIHVAVVLDARGDEIRREILEHAEAPTISRGLERGVDGLSGATITQGGVSLAVERAVTAGRRFLEEQR